LKKENLGSASIIQGAKSPPFQREQGGKREKIGGGGQISSLLGRKKRKRHRRDGLGSRRWEGKKKKKMRELSFQPRGGDVKLHLSEEKRKARRVAAGGKGGRGSAALLREGRKKGSRSSPSFQERAKAVEKDIDRDVLSP